jgi:iron complex transport system substrate-binding protein
MANAWYAGKILYPDAFIDIELARKTDEILDAFLGKKIYHELMSSSIGFTNLSIK